MKRSLILASLGAAMTLGLLFAHDEPHGKPITMTGQVIDTGCYLSHDSKDDAHLACAKMCANAGVPLAILDDSGKIYTVVAADHKNPNTRLMPFIQKKVKISGTLLQKGGLNGIAIKTVEAAE